MRYQHAGAQPVYAPNSFGGPQADPARNPDPTWQVDGDIVRTAQTLHSEDDDFGQAGSLYREILSDTDRQHLVENLVGHLNADVETAVQERSVEHWRQVDADLGAKVAAGIGLDGSPSRAQAGNGAVPEHPGQPAEQAAEPARG